MVNHISYTALGVALLAGASATNAQTVIAETPRTVIVREQPARTVETVRTVRTVEPARPMKSRHVPRTARAKVVTTTTTRTIVRDRIVPRTTVIAPEPGDLQRPGRSLLRLSRMCRIPGRSTMQRRAQ